MLCAPAATPVGIANLPVAVPVEFAVILRRLGPVLLSTRSPTISEAPKPLAVTETIVPANPLVGDNVSDGFTLNVVWAVVPLVRPLAKTLWVPAFADGTVIDPLKLPVPSAVALPIGVVVV